MMMSPYNLAEVITGSPFAKPVDSTLLLEKSERVSQSEAHLKGLCVDVGVVLVPRVAHIIGSSSFYAQIFLQIDIKPRAHHQQRSTTLVALRIEIQRV